LRLADLIERSGLHKPTVRRTLLALARGGLVEQDADTRHYLIGPDAYALGVAASPRFGVHEQSLGGLSRLALASGDSTFISIRRDTFAICLHREEGTYPIRTQVLKAGDQHPLGVGAGSLAILAALSDEEVERVLTANATVLRDQYPTYSPKLLRTFVANARQAGYAFNPGILVPGSWGIGIAVKDGRGRPIAALSIAAIESRLPERRRAKLVPLLRDEVQLLEATLRKPSAHSVDVSARPKRARVAAATRNRRTTAK
jgi:DNA-binding IclR family transcriptional regulator